VRALLGARLAIPCGTWGAGSHWWPAGNAAESSSRAPSRRAGQLRGETGAPSGEQIALIVWHKDEQLDSPVFVVDARKSSSLATARQTAGPGAQGAHLGGGRARVGSLSLGGASDLASEWQGATSGASTPALFVDEADPKDAGLYTCTLEFQRAPTQTHQTRVVIVDPPRNMLISSEPAGSAAEGAPVQRPRPVVTLPQLAGPFDEETPLVLTCRAEFPGLAQTGGALAWWRLEWSAPHGLAAPQASRQNRPPGGATNPFGPLLRDADQLLWLSTAVLASAGGHQRTVGPPTEQPSRHQPDLFLAVHPSSPHTHTQTQAPPPLAAHTLPLLRQWRRLALNQTRPSTEAELGHQLGGSGATGSGTLSVRLELGPLSRANLGDEYLCLAWNNDFSAPLNSSLKLDLNLRPSEVRIVARGGPQARPSFRLGQKTVVECRAFGSRPAPTIRWFRGAQELTGSESSGAEWSELGELTGRQPDELNVAISQQDGDKNLNNNFDNFDNENNSRQLNKKPASYISEYDRSDATPQGGHSAWNRSTSGPRGASLMVKVSYLTLIPQLADHQQTLTCSAFNPKLLAGHELLSEEPTGSGGAGGSSSSWLVSDSIQMDVQFAPKLSLRLNENIRPESIKLGDDVFMECQVEANPALQNLDQELVWLFNERPLQANVSAGVIQSNGSLALQRVRLEQRGSYQCSAANSLGRSTSNRLQLRPKFAPICDTSRTRARYELPLNQAAEIKCHALAEPDDELQFSWFFNQTLDSSPETSSARQLDSDSHDSSGLSQAGSGSGAGGFIGSSSTGSSSLGSSSMGSGSGLQELKQFETNRTQSTVIFTPKTRRHFGQLICRASNSMGLQSRPCIIQLVHSELPEPVLGCFVDNQTHSSFSVHCQPGANGQPAGERPVGAHWPRTSALQYVLELYAPPADEQELPRLPAEEPDKYNQSDRFNQQAPSGNQNHLSLRTPLQEAGSGAGSAEEEPTRGDYEEERAASEQRAQQQVRVRRLLSEAPSFDVENLRPNTVYNLLIFVQNSKGRSQPARHQASTRPPPATSGAQAASNVELGRSSGPLGQVSLVGGRPAAKQQEQTRLERLAGRLAALFSPGAWGQPEATPANGGEISSGISSGSGAGSGLGASPVASVALVLLLCVCSVLLVSLLLNRLLCQRAAAKRRLARRQAGPPRDSRPGGKLASSLAGGRKETSCSSNSSSPPSSNGDVEFSNARGRAERLRQLGPSPSGLANQNNNRNRSDNTSRETNTDSTLLVSSPQTETTTNGTSNDLSPGEPALSAHGQHSTSGHTLPTPDLSQPLGLSLGLRFEQHRKQRQLLLLAGAHFEPTTSGRPEHSSSLQRATNRAAFCRSAGAHREGSLRSVQAAYSPMQRVHPMHGRASPLVSMGALQTTTSGQQDSHNADTPPPNCYASFPSDQSHSSHCGNESSSTIQTTSELMLAGAPYLDAPTSGPQLDSLETSGGSLVFAREGPARIESPLFLIGAHQARNSLLPDHMQTVCCGSQQAHLQQSNGCRPSSNRCSIVDQQQQQQHGADCQLVAGTQLGHHKQFLSSSFSIPVSLSDRLQVLARANSLSSEGNQLDQVERHQLLARHHQTGSQLDLHQQELHNHHHLQQQHNYATGPGRMLTPLADGSRHSANSKLLLGGSPLNSQHADSCRLLAQCLGPADDLVINNHPMARESSPRQSAAVSSADHQAPASQKQHRQVKFET